MLSINKEDITLQIMEKLNFQRDKTISYINTLLDLVAESLIKDGKINIQGLGTFKLVEKKSRLGRNPTTGETHIIPARQTVSFVMYYKAREFMRSEQKKHRAC